MDNPEAQAILSTRQRRKTNKTKNGQPRDTGKYSLFYLYSSSVLCLILPVSLGCPFFILFVFLLCLVLNIACVSGLSNIRHKTEEEYK
jgi:hypothetical protein